MILYAEIDREELKGPRFQLDVAGHYSRPDIFQLAVRRQNQPLLRLEEDAVHEVLDETNEE